MFEQHLLQKLPQKLDEISFGLGYLIPELSLFVFFLIIIILDLLIKKYKVPVLTSVMVLALGFISFGLYSTPVIFVEIFGEALYLSPSSVQYRYLLVFTAALTVFIFLFSSFYHNQKQHLGVFYAILLAILLGLHLLILSNSFMILFVGIELVSIASYILVGQRSAKVGIKYLIFGAVASSVMLYGISWLYGMGGTLRFDVMVMQQPSLFHFLGVLMFLGGLLFKMGAFPMHMWVPEVYEQGPTPVIAFLSVAPKIATIAFLHHLMSWNGILYIVGELSISLQDVLVLLAILSITWGNLGALSSQNLKRMLGFSGIAQSGFVMMLLLAEGTPSHDHTLYFFLVYVLSNFLPFAVIAFAERQMDSALLSSWSGIGQKQVALGIFLLIAMLSLAGIPPTAGFTAKMAVFTDYWSKIYDLSRFPFVFYASVLVLAVLNTAIGLFYYLKLPFSLFFKGGERDVQFSKLQMLFLGLLAFLIVLLFFVPSLLS